MAYPYFPATYQPVYPQTAFQPQTGVNTQPMQNAPQTANNSLVWVQGVEGAKAHVTAPGVPALLMDSECERFYIKTTDASGMPLPLRVFEYKEVTNANTSKALEYVTQDEFNALKKSVEALEGKAAKHEQPSILDS